MGDGGYATVATALPRRGKPFNKWGNSRVFQRGGSERGVRWVQGYPNICTSKGPPRRTDFGVHMWG